jgi:hypothetical protein
MFILGQKAKKMQNFLPASKSLKKFLLANTVPAKAGSGNSLEIVINFDTIAAV